MEYFEFKDECLEQKQESYEKSDSYSSVICLSRFSSYQRRALLSICSVLFASNLNISILAPFFTNEASEKGMSAATSGLVFSSYSFTLMIFSPVFGIIVPKVGVKCTLISGILLSGLSNIAFGFLDVISDNITFTWMCFVIRAIEALGAAAFNTASYVYILSMFPESVGVAVGITETFIGIGMTFGPALGGLLYAWGGYTLPFAVLGCFTLINIPVCWLILKPLDSNTSEFDQNSPVGENLSYIRLLVIPKIAVVCLVVVVTNLMQEFMEPTLEPYIRTNYKVGAETLAFLFLLLSVIYGATSPAVGWMSSAIKSQFALMPVGLILNTMALLLLAPMDGLVPLKPQLWLTTIGMALMGFSYAVTFIPTLEAMLLIGARHGFPDNEQTNGLVSGLWGFMFSLGDLIGPIAGGLLSDTIGFPKTATSMATLCLLTSIITLGVFFPTGKLVSIRKTSL